MRTGRRRGDRKLEPAQHYARRATCVTYKDGFTQSGHVEVADWHNGEGVSVSVDDSPTVDLSWGQWTALSRAMRERAKAVKIEEERAKGMV